MAHQEADAGKRMPGSGCRKVDAEEPMPGSGDAVG
eukprot:CAMPEP_0183362618 /NCGR_PEP_ID=MMETSP0164_2-20130417/70549_1 /TAXON_ID=221442 /ORGANISM="Coccolithus pelagicus ssp braarudi, Strain PLY182g" /LENGTH=34 /DNA_ID= /DNA_START= /DNA_END= /DNA_ORIENTATION=